VKIVKKLFVNSLHKKEKVNLEPECPMQEDPYANCKWKRKVSKERGNLIIIK
jgi:hypothetical protein|tara:strand:+ start:169 stop:324 length:156 start_codon:yes stop_codon:yes gene_type:complete